MLNQTLTHDEQPFPPSFPPSSFAFLDYPSYKSDISQPDFEISNFCTYNRVSFVLIIRLTCANFLVVLALPYLIFC